MQTVTVPFITSNFISIPSTGVRMFHRQTDRHVKYNGHPLMFETYI